MASTDARPLPLKNTAYRVTFCILDADGDPVGSATGLDSEISKDGASMVDCTNEATYITSSAGGYYLDLTSAEMNYDCVYLEIKTTSSGAKTTCITIYPAEDVDIRANIVAINSDTTSADNCKKWFNGTGYASTNSTITSVGTVTGNVNGSVASVTAVTAANLTQIDGAATNGNNAVLYLKQLNCQNSTGSAIVGISTGADGSGIKAIGNGTGDGINATPGITGTFTGNLTGNINGFVTSLGAQAKTDVNAEVQNALVTNNLDHLLKVAAVAGDAVDSSIIARMTSKSATPSFASFVNTTDSLEAIKDQSFPATQAIVDGVWNEARSGHATAGTFGEGAASVQGNVTGTVTAVTTVATVSGAVGSVAGNVAGSLGSLSAQAKADVNAEVVDVINTDATSELSQAAPSATPSIRAALMLLYMKERNASTVTSSLKTIKNDAGTTICKSTLSDDGSTLTEAEYVAGP